MELTDIEDKIANGEMTAAQVFTQMRQHVDAATKLCAIYFGIAAECIGEEQVRECRDLCISKLNT